MWRVAVFAFLFAGLGVGVACGDSDGETDVATSTPQPDATDVPRADNEGGEAPIFWRTADGFASVRADELYKIVFRITGGYDQDTISLVAGPKGSDEEIAITADRVEAGDGELPGSYFATSLLLSQPGTWELTIVAGEDQATIQFEVAEAA